MAHVSTRAVTKTAMGSLRLYFQAAVTARPVGAGGGEITMQNCKLVAEDLQGVRIVYQAALSLILATSDGNSLRCCWTVVSQKPFASAISHTRSIGSTFLSHSLLHRFQKEHGSPHQAGHQMSFSQHLLHRIAWPCHPGICQQAKARCCEIPTPPMQGEAALALQCPAPRAGCCTLLGPILSVCCACRWEAIPFGLFANRRNSRLLDGRRQHSSSHVSVHAVLLHDLKPTATKWKIALCAGSNTRPAEAPGALHTQSAALQQLSRNVWQPERHQILVLLTWNYAPLCAYFEVP